jgi:hypothetical protein
MPTETMRRHAADNPYLHQDFHGALSCGIQYLDDHYGPDAVREYLRRFTDAFHHPLKAALRSRGLVPLADYLHRVYSAEGVEASIDLTPGELMVRIEACPAVSHMRSHGYRVADLWIETTRTVYERLCDDTPFEFDLVAYDDSTGAATLRFSRRPG